MKLNRLTPFLLIVGIALLLSACGGQLAATSWPGISSPDGTIYAAYANHVYAINSDNGAMIWRYPEKADRNMYYAAPVQLGDVVVAGNYGNQLVGIDAASGAQKWIFTGAKGRWIASPVVVNDIILAPNGDHFLYAIRPEGSLLWKFETEGPIWATPAATGDTVYQASMDHFLYALDLATGQQRWKLDMGGALIYSPTIGDDGSLYVITLANQLLSIDSASGKVNWTDDFEQSLWTQPTLHEGVLYFGDLAGNVYAVSAQNGAQQWTQNLGEGIAVMGAPTVFEDGVIFATEDDGIAAVSFDGQRQWTVPVNGKLYNGPVKSEDLLVLGITGGENLLAAFNQAGTQVWTFAPPK